MRGDRRRRGRTDPPRRLDHQQLDSEHADRQTIAEVAAERIRDLRQQLPGGSVPSPADDADKRITQAREFLASARKRKVSELPPSVLVRELAEARRQVGQLLTLVDDYEAEERLLTASYLTVSGGAHLVPADVEVLGQALADAIERRREHAAGECADCDTGPAGLCELAAGDLDQADAYVALAWSLGMGVDR